MKYFIKKTNEDNDYTITSEVEKIFGGSQNNNNMFKSRYIGYLSNVQWDDEEIREKIKTMQVGEEYEVNA